MTKKFNSLNIRLSEQVTPCPECGVKGNHKCTGYLDPFNPNVVFKDFDEALDFILKMQKSNPKKFPIQISPKIVKRNRNNLTIHILDDSNPDNPNIVESSKRIFNAARDDEDPDSFDTLQGLFQRTENPDEDYYRTLKEEEKGLSQYEKLDLTDFEEQKNLNDLEPDDESSEDFSNIRENPKRVMPCPNCDAESMINRTGLHVFTKTHCNNCDKECSSDEKNDRNHCEGCKNTLKCKGRTREIWSQKDENGKKITTCPVCQNEGFVPEEEYDSLLEERTFNPVEIQETESTPTTVPTFEHDTSAEDFKENYDPKNDTLIEPTPKKITPIIQKDNALSPAEALKKKKETISQMTKKNVVVTTTPEAPSATTAPKPVININPKKKACDCNTRGGLATDEEIATIKQSPEYNNGIARIKTQNISPAEKRKEINNFISNQTACKKCRENNG